MFTADQSPDRVQATPRAAAHLSDLARTGQDLVVVLSENDAAVVPGSALPDMERVFLGEVMGISCLADASAPTPWWRNRAVIDLHEQGGVTFQLTELSESEVFEALASGPLPRY